MGKSRKIITIILVAMLALFMNGAPAAKVYAEDTSVWVDGVKLDSTKKSINCGSGTATYDASTKTLTLKNATITNSCKGDSAFGNIDTLIYTTDSELTIVLEGENVLDGSSISGDTTNYGILTLECDLNIKGFPGLICSA